MDGVARLEGHLFELFVESGPKFIGEDGAVVEGVAGCVLHLFLQYAVELFHCVIHYLFLLILKLFLQVHCEFVTPALRPFFPIGYLSDVLVENLQCFWFEFFDFLEVLLLAEDLACGVKELSKAVIGDKIGLFEEALLDLIVEFFLELMNFLPLVIDLEHAWVDVLRRDVGYQ